MRVMNRNHLFFLLCAMSVAGGSALAQERPRPAQHGERHKPPEAAFTACADLEEGAACTVTFKEHSLEGHCVAAHDAERLVCAPERPNGPPPEAQAACADKAEGDSCSATGPDGETLPEGVCATGRHGLHCRPAHPASDE